MTVTTTATPKARPMSHVASAHPGNAKPSCHGESVAALVQRRWRPLCVNTK